MAGGRRFWMLTTPVSLTSNWDGLNLWDVSEDELEPLLSRADASGVLTRLRRGRLAALSLALAALAHLLTSPPYDTRALAPSKAQHSPAVALRRRM